MSVLTLLTPFTPFQARRESPHGQGVISYGASNELHTELVGGQDAPDPIRQSDTPARRPRRQVAIMSTDPASNKYGFADAFLGDGTHVLTKRIMPAGRVVNVRSQNSVGVRPNIVRPPAVAYGSLFELDQSTYDIA